MTTSALSLIIIMRNNATAVGLAARPGWSLADGIRRLASGHTMTRRAPSESRLGVLVSPVCRHHRGG